MSRRPDKKIAIISIAVTFLMAFAFVMSPLVGESNAYLFDTENPNIIAFGENMSFTDNKYVLNSGSPDKSSGVYISNTSSDFWMKARISDMTTYSSVFIGATTVAVVNDTTVAGLDTFVGVRIMLASNGYALAWPMYLHGGEFVYDGISRAPQTEITDMSQVVYPIDAMLWMNSLDVVVEKTGNTVSVKLLDYKGDSYIRDDNGSYENTSALFEVPSEISELEFRSVGVFQEQTHLAAPWVTGIYCDFLGMHFDYTSMNYAVYGLSLDRYEGVAIINPQFVLDADIMKVLGPNMSYGYPWYDNHYYQIIDGIKPNVSSAVYYTTSAPTSDFNMKMRVGDWGMGCSLFVGASSIDNLVETDIAGLGDFVGVRLFMDQNLETHVWVGFIKDGVPYFGDTGFSQHFMYGHEDVVIEKVGDSLKIQIMEDSGAVVYQIVIVSSDISAMQFQSFGAFMEKMTMVGENQYQDFLGVIHEFEYASYDVQGFTMEPKQTEPVVPQEPLAPVAKKPKGHGPKK